MAPEWWTVTVYSSAVGRVLAGEAEFQRQAIARRWLGGELSGDKRRPLHVVVIRSDDPVPPPPTGSLIVLYRRGGPVESSSELTFAGGRLTRPWIHLAGPLEDVLENDLPREMTHVVLAAHFGKPLPRWAADGAARLAESAASQAKYDVCCRAMLTDGTAFHRSWMFKCHGDTGNRYHIVAESHSVTRFLLTRKAVLKTPVTGDVPHLAELFRNPARPEAAFLAFAQLGAEGDWDKAAKVVYGFDGVAALENAWIGWSSTPESRLANGEDPKRPVVTPMRNMPPSWYIPPVMLSDGR
jgi:hypothetical protein